MAKQIESPPSLNSSLHLGTVLTHQAGTPGGPGEKSHADILQKYVRLLGERVTKHRQQETFVQTVLVDT